MLIDDRSCLLLIILNIKFRIDQTGRHTRSSQLRATLHLVQSKSTPCTEQLNTLRRARGWLHPTLALPEQQLAQRKVEMDSKKVLAFFFLTSDNLQKTSRGINFEHCKMTLLCVDGKTKIKRPAKMEPAWAAQNTAVLHCWDEL